MITLVIPVYNISHLASSLFENLLHSNPNIFEILLIDDGSVDDTFSQLKTLIDENGSHHIEIYTKKNGGVSSARNFGLSKVSSQSKYICFYDSDDFIHFDTLHDLYASLSNADNLVDILFFNFERKELSNLHKVEHGLPATFDIQGYFVKLYTRGLIQPCWNKVYRADLIKDNGLLFDENISMGEDFRFNLNYMIFCNNFSSNEHTVYTYNVYTTDSLSNKYNSNSFELFKQGIEQVNVFCNLKNIEYTHLNNRFLYALRDRLSNLYRSGLSLNKSKDLFAHDFNFVSTVGGIEYSKITSLKDKVVFFFLMIKSPLLLFSFFFFVFHLKAITAKLKS